MEKQTSSTDLLTLALRRAHAETAEWREPPPDDGADVPVELDQTEDGARGDEIIER